jgi:hypothetical protein
MFNDRGVYPRLELNLYPILFGFHSMNPNYINECTKIVGEHNKHENVIAIWDELIKKVQP